MGMHAYAERNLRKFETAGLSLFRPTKSCVSRKKIATNLACFLKTTEEC